MRGWYSARLARLVVGVDLPLPVAFLHGALRPVGVRRVHRRPHLVQADPVLVERRRIQLDAHGGQRAAAHRHLAYALDLRELLGEYGRGGVVHAPAIERVGRERQDHDRRVGGIDLAVDRVVGEPGRELAARRVDGGLHVARGAVDVPVELELEGDPRRAERGRGGDLRHARDAPERALERRRDGGRHGLGTRAGQLHLHRDRREIHLRQRRHGEQLESHHPRERQPYREERGGDRAPDERLGDVDHGRPPSVTLGVASGVASGVAPRAARRTRPVASSSSSSSPRRAGPPAAPCGRTTGRSRGW